MSDAERENSAAAGAPGRADANDNAEFANAGSPDAGHTNSGLAGAGLTGAGLTGAGLILTAVLLVVFPLFAWFGYQRSGDPGIIAAVVAGVVCWIGALSALILTVAFRQTQMATSATLGSMFFRLGLPLLTGIVLNHGQGELARAGVFGMILCYYFVALIAETILSVRLVSNHHPSVAKA